MKIYKPYRKEDPLSFKVLYWYILFIVGALIALAII